MNRLRLLPAPGPYRELVRLVMESEIALGILVLPSALALQPLYGLSQCFSLAWSAQSLK